MPKDGGYIEFYDPLEYHKAHLPRVIDDQQSNWKAVPTVTGDVVLFPGWLKHRTQKNKSNENRWVLTTNYICTNIPIAPIK
jgi:ectoine hydroxylase-related dioxygenase (phytanoyl-CoA dioxygenase family)